MIVDNRLHVAMTLVKSRLRLTALVGYCLLVVILYKAGLKLDLPVFAPGILGTVLAILLGFRTNSSYDRWWEARKIWGSIVNDSRSFARQVLTLLGERGADGSTTPDIAAMQKELIYRHMCWNWVLDRSLRKQDPKPELARFLDNKEAVALRSQSSVVSSLLVTQAQTLRTARDQGHIDTFTLLRFDEMLTRFSDSMGMCERIKNTVFPATYSRLVKTGTWLLFLLIPHGIVAQLGWATVPVSILIDGVFILIEMISCMLQDPFENHMSDTPMDTICTTIEINLRQQLGETDLPLPLEPVNGILM